MASSGRSAGLDGGEPLFDQCGQKLAECERLLVASERLNAVLQQEAEAMAVLVTGPKTVPLHSPVKERRGRNSREPVPAGDLAVSGQDSEKKHEEEDEGAVEQEGSRDNDDDDDDGGGGGEGDEDDDSDDDHDGDVSALDISNAADDALSAQELLREALEESVAHGDGTSDGGSDPHFNVEVGEATLAHYLHTVRCFLDDLRSMAKLKRYHDRIDATHLRQIGFRVAAVKARVQSRVAARLSRVSADRTRNASEADSWEKESSADNRSSGDGIGDGEDTLPGASDTSDLQAAVKQRLHETQQQARAALAGEARSNNSRRAKSAASEDMHAQRVRAEEEALELATLMRRRLQNVNAQIKDDVAALDGLDAQIDDNSEFLAKQQEKIDERLANQLGICKVLKWVIICTAVFVAMIIFIFIT